MMDIKCTAARWTGDERGTWLCLLTPQAVKLAEAMQEGAFDVKIQRHRQKRSLSANAYFWVLLDKLAAATGGKKEDIYREAVRNIGGNAELVCVRQKAAKKLRESWSRNGLGWITETMDSKLPGCVNVLLYYGSSTYDTQQMSRLIDLLVQDCRALGIETLPEERLTAMLEAWDA